MAFEKIKFAMKTWKDAVSGGTPITAAELNRIEKGISDTAKGINDLGDSVSPFSGNIITSVISSVVNDNVMQIRFTASDGKSYGFSLLRNGIRLYCFTDSVEVWRITK